MLTLVRHASEACTTLKIGNAPCNPPPVRIIFGNAPGDAVPPQNQVPFPQGGGLMSVTDPLEPVVATAAAADVNPPSDPTPPVEPAPNHPPTAEPVGQNR